MSELVGVDLAGTKVAAARMPDEVGGGRRTTIRRARHGVRAGVIGMALFAMRESE